VTDFSQRPKNKHKSQQQHPNRLIYNKTYPHNARKTGEPRANQCAGIDSPQTKTTNKAINYTAVQAQVALRGALTTINGSNAGITADSYAEPRASKCRLSVCFGYVLRIPSVLHPSLQM
jgi:hypothetical protein